MPNISLSELGLTKQESAVYLAALELGFGSISNIAKKACIKRPTTYNIVDDLMRKNLISRSPKGKRSIYIAEPPQNLLQEIRMREERFMSVLPQLEALQKAGARRPRIRFCEGKDAIAAAYRELFQTHGKMYALGSLQNVLGVFDLKDEARWFQLLRDHGGKIYDLIDDSKESREYLKQPSRKGMGPYKFLPANFKISTDMLVSGNEVLFVSYSTMVAVLIENAEIAETQRQSLEFIWKHL